ncbi:MAG: hypothetical protein HC828_13680 [Blastochloris sp.]|nr:hypothetical protein [Blastochloris sp.]
MAVTANMVKELRDRTGAGVSTSDRRRVHVLAQSSQQVGAEEKLADRRLGDSAQ